MSNRSGVKVTVKDDDLKAMMRRIRAEADGKQLRKDLTADLKTAVGPGVAAVQGKLRGMPHHSHAVTRPPMGTYLASRVKPQIRLSGRSAGVKVRIGATPKLRGFAMAARWLNRHSWRHKVYGNEKVWVTQHSPMPGFFDDILAQGRSVYRAAVVDALNKAAARLARRGTA